MTHELPRSKPRGITRKLLGLSFQAPTASEGRNRIIHKLSGENINRITRPIIGVILSECSRAKDPSTFAKATADMSDATWG